MLLSSCVVAGKVVVAILLVVVVLKKRIPDPGGVDTTFPMWSGTETYGGGMIQRKPKAVAILSRSPSCPTITVNVIICLFPVEVSSVGRGGGGGGGGGVVVVVKRLDWW